VAVRLERFDCDVTPLFCHTEGPPITEAAALLAQSVSIAFARLPNLAPAELRVNDAVVGLLERCDGTARTDDLIERLSADRPAERAAVATKVVAALGQLYASGLLAFTDAATTAAPLIRGW
jgi:hypothetical protein